MKSNIRWLVADLRSIVSLLAQSDLEHRDDMSIHFDATNLVVLMKTLEFVLDKSVRC